MNRFVVRSALVRELINGGGRSYSSSSSGSGRYITRTVLRNDHPVGSAPYMMRWRTMSSSTAAATPPPEKKEEDKEKEKEVVVASYWGISRPKITREDGTEWPWNCFMPWETYRSNTSIDLEKHHVPKTFLDKVAYRTVKILRWPTDIFFQDIHYQGKELREAPAPLGYH
ncbi:hypothetical protein Tsubulata_035970 [Turnera subulata]|uniref:ubiquinol oxidase (non-electrogenic) n=1 Tax=Turnera subulata TaxID=218843 RepID=A0A9Q0FDX7_9ROSI|nr:hypothetical protein Tsubulata_035970 [Turnera subulata]